MRAYARDQYLSNGTIRTEIHSREVSNSNFEVGTSLDCSQLETMTARRHPVTIPGDTEDTDIRDRIRIRMRPGKTLKLHLPEGYGMSATSTTKLEPLSDHGTAARVRHSREHLPLDPLNSRRSLSREFTPS